MPIKRNIRYLNVADLIPNPKNARTHSKKQLRQISASISRFGFINPIIIDSESTILAGHGRAVAARMLGMAEVPCVQLDDMSAADKRAYMLAENKIAQNAGWDEELLASELQFLTELGPDFDMEVTGFSIAEVDDLIEGLALEDAGNPLEDKLPPLASEPRVKLGDLWEMGEHRLLCGTALDRVVVETLMAGEKATMVFTDPPYNVPIDGHVGGSGKTKHREFAMAAGEMPPAQFIDFLGTGFRNMAAVSVDGAIHFICMDWRHMAEMHAAAEGIYSALKNLIVWVKDNGGMGSFYRSRHELIFAFKVGTAPHVNSFELGQHGRYRTNVWQYKGVNSFKKGRMQELEMHPTVKPVQMIADAIKDVSARGQIVLDVFAGSGSTLIAAHKTGRRAYLVELDPVYCDRIIRRWETYSNDEAVLIASGVGVAACQEITA